MLFQPQPPDGSIYLWSFSSKAAGGFAFWFLFLPLPCRSDLVTWIESSFKCCRSVYTQHTSGLQLSMMLEVTNLLCWSPRCVVVFWSFEAPSLHFSVHRMHFSWCALFQASRLCRKMRVRNILQNFHFGWWNLCLIRIVAGDNLKLDFS